MTEARFSQDELVCAVCLDLPKEPVSIQCGHSYCMNCITDFWDLEDQKRVYSCPQCRQSFSQRPALAKNTMLAEVVEKLKKTKLSADCYAGAGDVQCDVCTGRKYKAVRSCLMCLNSYCQNHLEQHESFFKGKRHNLTEATGRLQEMICHEHDKHLEMYCITDQRCICVLCAKYEHENHNTVSAAAQRTEKQHQLKETRRSLQQRIQQREKDLQQLREDVESRKRSAQTAVEESERICTELIRSIERSRSEVTQMIRDQEKTAVSRAEGRLERLEQEINDLRRRDAELEQLSHTQDHIQFLQSFQSLSAPPESTDVNDDLFSSLVSSDALRESVHQLRDRLEDFCKEPLQKISFFKGKRHNLTEATGRLQEMICHEHDKHLEMYCITDQRCICVLCAKYEHENHNTVSAAAQRTEKQHQLKETQRRFQQRLQQREKDLQQLREDVESRKRSAQTAVEDSERICTELIRSIESSRSEVTQMIRDQEKTAVSRAEGRLERLEQEINDLRRRDAELEQLSHTQDHIQFLQSFQSLSAPPESTDVNDDLFSSLVSSDALRESVHQLRDRLEDFCKEELKKISDRETLTNVAPRTRNDFLRYSRRLSLDPNTVNEYLRLSESNSVITYTYTEQPYPDHPDRFDVFQVLCRESVCGRCYWEIEWSGSVLISVSYKSLSTKGLGNESVFGYNDQSWSLSCSPSRCSFIHNNIVTKLPAVSSSRIGVFVDLSAGTLSFYSVSDTMSLIHTVQTAFTQTLYPGFLVDYGSSVKLC
ncbi:tripartite motif-containing protein 16-like [Sinocyclocheilus grahami]|uniref:tripartite motif-containing protein 16-like n=1 Tax=Sinocyclocheilus grahami TaxID=75366 RepID=UPI0007AD62C1|nr:PREDICTED: tripartite motif-containing protein 16-like [Sinocyclocheilus grahami]